MVTEKFSTSYHLKLVNSSSSYVIRMNYFVLGIVERDSIKFLRKKFSALIASIVDVVANINLIHLIAAYCRFRQCEEASTVADSDFIE